MGKRTRLECGKIAQSIPLLSIQNGDRPRPTLFPRHCPGSTPLVSLGEIVRQSFAKLATLTQSLLQFLLDKKNGGSRTIAILHTTCRLTMRLITAHITPMVCQFRGGILRSRATQRSEPVSQVLRASNWPRDWLPASELAECAETRMWEWNGSGASASSNLLGRLQRIGR